MELLEDDLVGLPDANSLVVLDHGFVKFVLEHTDRLHLSIFVTRFALSGFASLLVDFVKFFLNCSEVFAFLQGL